MSNKHKIWLLPLLIAILCTCPRAAGGQVLDTAGALKEMATELKSYNTMAYHYVETAEFPNGDKDKLEGEMYINGPQKFLYNNCDAFLMVCSEHWLYKADHRKKTVVVADLDRKKNATLKKDTQKQLFTNGLLSTFIDSVLLKTAVIKHFKQMDTLMAVSLIFPKGQLIRQLDITYNWKTRFPVSYEMITFQPMQKTAKGIEGVKATIKCDKFNSSPDISSYAEDKLFLYEKGKIELKDYKNYQLSTEM